MYDTAIVIGRFQPVHNGHLTLLHEALARAQRVIVVIGSAHQARTPKNPFTWSEREALLRAALPAADAARLMALPISDHYDDTAWAQTVRAAITPHTPLGQRIALIGHFKDASSGYLSDFPHWELLRMPRHTPADATRIRDAWFAATPFTAETASWLHPATHTLLAQFTHTPAFAALQQEWHMLRKYHAAWAAAPYPPVFVTVDALLRCQNQVLLIRRARAPGKGLLALPGGFLDPHETLWQACLRELAEETCCSLPEATLRAALRQVSVFDHPARSQRGRTITHAHYFDLGNAPLPEVRAADDAAQALWAHIDLIHPSNQLTALQEQFFEDHFHILGHFLTTSHPA